MKIPNRIDEILGIDSNKESESNQMEKAIANFVDGDQTEEEHPEKETTINEKLAAAQ